MSGAFRSHEAVLKNDGDYLMATQTGIGHIRAKQGTKTQKRKFFFVGPDRRVGGPKEGIKLLNKATLLKGSNRVILGPERNRRGFPTYPETPIFMYDKRIRDIEVYHFYWLVSDRMKVFLETFDPAAVVFLECKTRLPDGQDGPIHWLCDIVRVLDAIDKEKSVVRMEPNGDGPEIYDTLGCKSFILKEDIVGSAHLFRSVGLMGYVVCDEAFKLSAKTASLKGLNYRELSNFNKYLK